MRNKDIPMASNEEYKWKVERSADTLIEAEKIRKDKKLMKDVRKELQNRLKATKEAAGSTKA